MKKVSFSISALAIAINMTGLVAGTPQIADSTGKDFKQIPITLPPEKKPWSINFAPYGWLTFEQGTVGFNGTTAKVNENPRDILKTIDAAFMGVLEIRYQRFGIMGDFIYSRSSSDASTPYGIFYSKAHSELEQFIGTFTASYRPLEAKWGFLDVLAGVRVYSISTSLHLDGNRLPRLGVTVPDVNLNRSLAWVDPVVGLKGRVNISHWFFVNAYGDVGGFGAGSDFSWQAVVGTGIQVSRWCALVGGYRGLGYNYRQDGLILDLVTHGPYSGVEISF